MKQIVLAVVLASPAIVLAQADRTSLFTAPQQPWTSSDRQVRLLRPAVAQDTDSQVPLGSLMTQGWRLDWSGETDAQGTIATRLILPAVPTSARGQVKEVLQIGWSASPEALRTCLTFGLSGSNTKRLPPRTINGVSFAAFSNNDSGMSQSIDAIDLRAAVGDRCYAVERFSYAVEASDADAMVKLTKNQGAGMLDASLASLHLGPGQPLATPQAITPMGTVAR